MGGNTIQMERKNSTLIQSIERAIHILDCFSETASSLTLLQISQQTNLNINTTRGLVNTLVHYNLLFHDDITNMYSLGLYFVFKSRLIHSSQRLGSLGDIARPWLQHITDKYNLFCSLQVVSQDQIFMVETQQPRKSHYHITTPLYTPFECHCTASGKLYLQYLPYDKLQSRLDVIEFPSYTPYTITDKQHLIDCLHEQKKRSYSTEFDETAIGISSIAAPILSANQHLIGTISVTAPSKTVAEMESSISKDLLEAADHIAQAAVSSSNIALIFPDH